MEADVNGPQRGVKTSEVRPVSAEAGSAGIGLRDGRTVPFRVARGWVAPAGYYQEAWYLVQPDTKEVLYEAPVRLTRIWGLQGLTELVDEVTDAIALAPGRYLIVFALGGIKGGEVEVEAFEAVEEAAA